ncbi:MAG: hypothetical protein GWO23_24485 [Gammaproteobacteria bacterium]|nr:hypothetical protein [Gammaproteobacteria bacterium]
MTHNKTALRLEQHNHKKENKMQYDTNLIPNRQVPTPVEAYVTNFTKSGAAFLREMNGNRDVFVPISIVEKTGLNRGDRVFAMAVTNKLYETWTPQLGVMQPAELFAIHVMNAQDYEQMAEQAASDEALEEPTLEDRILDVLEHGPATATHVLRILNDSELETRHVFDALCDLHDDGEVSRATIKQRADQKQASFVVWALTTKELIPPMSAESELEF